MLILSDIIHRFLPSANTVLHLVSQSVYLLFCFLSLLHYLELAVHCWKGVVENKINKIDKPLAKLNKRKKKIQEIKGDITNDATKIQRINLKACLIPLYLHVL